MDHIQRRATDGEEMQNHVAASDDGRELKMLGSGEERSWSLHGLLQQFANLAVY